MHRTRTAQTEEQTRSLEVTAPDGETVTMALAESANMGEVKGEIERQTGKPKRTILLFLPDATPAFETLIGGADRALPYDVTVAEAMQGTSKQQQEGGQEEEGGQGTQAAPLRLYMTINDSTGGCMRPPPQHHPRPPMLLVNHMPCQPPPHPIIIKRRLPYLHQHHHEHHNHSYNYQLPCNPPWLRLLFPSTAHTQ